MTVRLYPALVAACLCVATLPSQAQYAYVSVPARVASAPDSADPADGLAAAPTKVLHGVVQGTQGALPGATVWLHGTRTIVVTNAEGEFELRVPANQKTIELTCGYGGLQEEVVRFAPSQALGSIYLLRSKAPDQAVAPTEAAR